MMSYSPADSCTIRNHFLWKESPNFSSSPWSSTVLLWGLGWVVSPSWRMSRLLMIFPSSSNPSLSPLSPPGLILPLAVSILHCWDCGSLGVGIPDIEVGGPGVGLCESFHQSFQSIISSFPFVPVAFLEVPWYGTSLFDLTFISETMGKFHAHPF